LNADFVVSVLIGIVLGVFGTLSCQSTVGSTGIPSRLGELVTGTAAMIAALFGVLGFGRWKVQKRKERQAEVAGNALMVASELSSLMRHLAAGPQGPYPIIDADH
jgi:hypothetical protein